MTTTATRTIRAALYERVSSEEQVEGYSSMPRTAPAGSTARPMAGRSCRSIAMKAGVPAPMISPSAPPSSRCWPMPRPGSSMSSSSTSSTASPATCASRSRRWSDLERSASASSPSRSRWTSRRRSAKSSSPPWRLRPVLLRQPELRDEEGQSRAQGAGLYNGLLPFGLKTNPDGIPVPDPETYPGCCSPSAWRPRARATARWPRRSTPPATARAATAVAIPSPKTPSACCSRTGSTSANSRRAGRLGPWPRISPCLTPSCSSRPSRRGRQPAGAGTEERAAGKRTHSLSGLGTCAHCGSRLHVMTDRHGKARIYCYASRQGQRCGQRSVHLGRHRSPARGAPRTFHLPDETVAEVVRLYERANDQRDDAERRRREIRARIERIAEMYKWGDLTRRPIAPSESNSRRSLGRCAWQRARPRCWCRRRPS